MHYEPRMHYGTMGHVTSACSTREISGKGLKKSTGDFHFISLVVTLHRNARLLVPQAASVAGESIPLLPKTKKRLSITTAIINPRLFLNLPSPTTLTNNFCSRHVLREVNRPNTHRHSLFSCFCFMFNPDLGIPPRPSVVTRGYRHRSGQTITNNIQ